MRDRLEKLLMEEASYSTIAQEMNRLFLKYHARKFPLDKICNELLTETFDYDPGPLGSEFPPQSPEESYKKMLEEVNLQIGAAVHYFSRAFDSHEGLDFLMGEKDKVRNSMTELLRLDLEVRHYGELLYEYLGEKLKAASKASLSNEITQLQTTAGQFFSMLPPISDQSKTILRTVLEEYMVPKLQQEYGSLQSTLTESFPHLNAPSGKGLVPITRAKSYSKRT